MASGSIVEGTTPGAIRDVSLDRQSSMRGHVIYIWASVARMQVFIQSEGCEHRGREERKHKHTYVLVQQLSPTTPLVSCTATLPVAFHKKSPCQQWSDCGVERDQFAYEFAGRHMCQTVIEVGAGRQWGNL